MNVELDELIKKTEEYLNSDLNDKNMVQMVLEELLKIKDDNNYLIPEEITFSLLDSFDWSSEYWKKYLYPYWKANRKNFDPIRK